MRRHAIWLAFLALLVGCPDSGKGSGDAASLNSGVPMAGKIQKKPKDQKTVEPPRKDEGMSHDVLVALYKAEQLGDKTVLVKHGLLDDKGREVPARRDEYEAALKRFAEDHGDELSVIANELEAAKVTTPQPADVQKK